MATRLRACGGFSVDMAWTNGVLTSATIHSIVGTRCRVQYGSRTNELLTPVGGSAQFVPTNAPFKQGISDNGLANRTIAGLVSVRRELLGTNLMIQIP